MRIKRKDPDVLYASELITLLQSSIEEFGSDFPVTIRFLKEDGNTLDKAVNINYALDTLIGKNKKHYFELMLGDPAEP